MNKRLKHVVEGLLGIGLVLTLGKAALAVDATITVTPNPSLNLTIAPTTYSFGTPDVAVSSVSVSSLTITNAGQVVLTINKAITNQSAPAGWTAATIASPLPGANKYALYVATSTTKPGMNEFVDADHLFNGETNSNALKGLSGSTPALAISDVADVWFKLAMPTSIGSAIARTITVSFTGAAQ